ncbi:interleukin-8-like protein [Labeo rohita]|uniref:Interleukin-8-like protein n=2 Tax=Labeo rohita TaxID=84645 RepID=A0A498MGQ6_LABRO|nr:interleukin-8 [Labeo rohita]KAI2663131.1 Interleukin-8 [Labeo rohita]RXN19013.1 interleukin-8-like protein [Labeo rohita]
MKTFTASATVLLICTAALLSTTDGISIYLRCECLKTHSKPQIPAERILSLRVIPAGPKCKNEEIIATVKKGQTCLDPTEGWVISLKEEINKRNNTR